MNEVDRDASLWDASVAFLKRINEKTGHNYTLAVHTKGYFKVLNGKGEVFDCGSAGAIAERLAHVVSYVEES